MGGDSCQAPAHVSASHTIREAGGFLRLTALEMESQRVCLAVRFQDGLLRPPPGLLVVVCCPLSTYVQGTRVHDILIKRGSRPYTDGSSPRATQGRSARRPDAGPPPQPPRAAVPRSPRGVCSAVGPASVTPCAWSACVLSSSAPDRRPLGTGVVCPRTLRAQRAPSTGGAPSSA